MIWRSKMPNLLYDIGGRLTIIFVNIALHILDNKVSCSMVLYSTVQYSTVQYHTHLYTSFRMIISYKSIRFLGNVRSNTMVGCGIAFVPYGTGTIPYRC